MHNLFLKEGRDGWSRMREGSSRSQVRAAAQDLPAAMLGHSESTRGHRLVWKLFQWQLKKETLATKGAISILNTLN